MCIVLMHIRQVNHTINCLGLLHDVQEPQRSTAVIPRDGGYSKGKSRFVIDHSDVIDYVITLTFVNKLMIRLNLNLAAFRMITY